MRTNAQCQRSVLGVTRHYTAARRSLREFDLGSLGNPGGPDSAPRVAWASITWNVCVCVTKRMPILRRLPQCSCLLLDSRSVEKGSQKSAIELELRISPGGGGPPTTNSCGAFLLEGRG